MRRALILCFRTKVIVLVSTFWFMASMSQPADAATLRVCGSGCTFTDFQAALDAALPGDTILLRAGETFVGHFVLPEKAAASGPAILIRSDAPDSALPPADTRLVPNGYAGGNTALSSLARLRGRGGIWKTTPVLKAAPRAHHYRLQFLDIDGIVQEGYYTLLELGTNSDEQATADSTPYAIVFDRVFVHGHPTKGQQRCISMNGRDLEVRNSYVTDCSSFAVDSQAIGAFNAPGPLKIINNYLEAATENVMLGGADPRIPGLVQSDVEIRRNHFFKPTAWRNPILAPPSAPSASVAGSGTGNLQPGNHYFKVVAVLESGGDIALSGPSGETSVDVGGSNAAVVLNWSGVAGADRYRVYLGSWPGGQDRYIETSSSDTQLVYRAEGEVWESPPTSGQRWNVKNLLELKNAQRVLIDGNLFEYLWPASQSGYAILFSPRNDEGRAPWSAVRDVTFTNNILRHASGGINILGQDYLQVSERTERITIRNNLFYDLSFDWGGHAHALLITGSPLGVKVDHNSFFHDGMVMLADGGATWGFEFTNNVAPHNDFGFFGSGAGTGSPALDVYFPGAVFRRNALGGGPASQYPADNLFPSMSTFNAQFVNLGANDYRLVAGSLFRNAGTDAKDLGVDFAALNAAQASAGGSGPVTPEPDPDPGGGGGGGGGGGSGGGPTPYPSTPVALPGTIQAENFDNGGASIGYSDTTAGNSGGEYRSTDVDVEATGDTGGGYNVGWAFAGEWLSYSVTVAAAGTYDIDVRVASPAAGGTFHIEANDVNITGPLTVPDTGGWQTWTTVRRSGVTLAAGTQRWRLVLDTNGATEAVGNFNDIRVNSTAGGGSGGGGGGSGPAYNGTPAALPGTVQAEDFDTGGEGSGYHDLSASNEGGAYRDTGVDVESSSDAGGGHSVGWMFAGEWLNYTVNVTAGGTYDLEVRVASMGGGGTFHLEINGTNVTGPIAIGDTGGWQAWSTVRMPGLSLSAGQQVWRLVMDSNGPSTAVGNINFLRVVSATSAPTGGDVVLYSSDVSTMVGNWSRVGSTSGAGGLKMQSSDNGASNAEAALASPSDYFEAQFVPQANRPYRLWLRLRATGDSKFNDSIWVQFSGAVDSGGSPLWRTGTGSGLLVNLEACAGCGSASWGWSNGAWWLSDTGIVTFPSTATQTIRIQTREDGLDIDQIVLSPATYFDRPPGATVGDTTIVPK